MSPLDTDAIAARLNAITRPPWVSDGKIEGWWGGECPAVRVTFQREGDRATGTGVWGPVCMVDPRTHNPVGDADFIACAPGDIAALLAEVATLREALRAFVESDAIVNYDSSLCWGCGGSRHARYETSPLDEHSANCILAGAREVLGVSRLTEEPK